MAATEIDVGIREYITKTPGFTGIMRSRFTDFKVNEVDLDGQVVRLTTFQIPEPLDAPQQEEEPSAPLESAEDVVAAFAHAVGEDFATDTTKQGLEAFLKAAEACKADIKQQTPAPLTLGPLPDKNMRRSVHQLFKNLAWLPPMQTEAVALAGSSDLHGIQLQLTRGGKSKRKREDGNQFARQQRKQAWQGGSGAKYLRFALFKENYDSHHALSTIAKTLHVRPKVFSIAGTKDKRGVTVQWVSAYHVAPEKLAGVNKAVRGIRVGNFSYSDRQMQLGDLSGNRFDIILRGLSAQSVEAVEAAAAAVKAAGFVNYYGLQRFGSSDVPTHRVGIALLRGQWEEAIKCIMTPAGTTNQAVAAACEAFLAGGDADAALAAMPYNLVGERAVLGVLAKDRTAVVTALQAVPRNLRTMYIHAYQSYLWNEAASHRVREHGADKVIAGDLVVSRKAVHDAKKAKISAFSGAAGDVADANGGGAGKDESEAEEESFEVEPKVVTAEEAAAGVYVMDDVVLPLPGHKIIYPENDVAEVYRTVAARDGVSLDSPAHRVKEFSQLHHAGAYRHVLFRPSDLEYEVLRYDDKDANLAGNDVDAMQGRAAPATATGGKFLALRLSFTLPSSTYATMLIRELTKMPTTVEYARNLQHPE